MNDREPKPSEGRPKMPAGLSRPEQAKWRQVVKLLEHMRVLTTADGDAIAAYVSTWCQWWDANQVVKDLGPVNEDGKLRPESRLSRDLLPLLHRFMTDFGLTPVARTRLHAAPAADDVESMDSFLGFSS